MAQQNFNWTTPDGINIYATHWPVDQPKAVIALVHGLGEHVNRYGHLASFLNGKGIALTGYDRRGHGQSGGKKGHTSSVDAFLDEIDSLIQKTKEFYPDTPLFLYGHSMGGNLVLTHALKRQPEIIGLISTAPHIRLGFEPPAALIAFGRIIKYIYPAFTQGSGLEVAHISKNQTEVQKYIDDPLVHDRITSATGIGMIDAAKWLDNYKGNMPVPTLIMHGEADQITSPEGSQLFSERVGGALELKIWPNLYHEIHNEEEQQEVFEFALNWIEKHL